jgi:HSP90 family molecular chaperone
MQAHLDQGDEKDSEKTKKKLEKQEKENEDFLVYTQKTIGEDLLEGVKLSTKMKSSLAMLTAKEGQTSAQMERMMQAMGQEIPK